MDHRFDFACKSPLKDAPAELTPWFNLDNPLYKQIPIVFGHWASLVDEPTPKGIYALDTGCVWNNRMTMLRWEDKQFFTQSAVKNYSDFKETLCSRSLLNLANCSTFLSTNSPK